MTDKPLTYTAALLSPPVRLTVNLNSLDKSIKRFTPEEVAARKADKKQANFKRTNYKKAKLVRKVDVEKLDAENAAANQLAKKLRSEITTVSCVCTGKTPYGAFYRVTTPGETLGLIGLWHVSDMPGGATELAAIAVEIDNTEIIESTETAMVLDIIGARVENSGRSPIVKLSLIPRF